MIRRCRCNRHRFDIRAMQQHAAAARRREQWRQMVRRALPRLDVRGKP